MQDTAFGVKKSGDRGQGFRVQGSGFRVQGAGFRVQGSGFRVQGSGFRVPRGCRVSGGFKAGCRIVSVQDLRVGV